MLTFGQDKPKAGFRVGAAEAVTAGGLALLLACAISTGTARAQSALAQQYGSEEDMAQQSAGQQQTTPKKQQDIQQTNGPKAPSKTAVQASSAKTAKKSTASTGVANAKPAPAKSTAQQPNATSTTAKKTAAAGAVNKAAPTKSADSKPAAAKPVKSAAKKAPAKPVVYLNESSPAKTAANASSKEPGTKDSGKSQNSQLAKAFEQGCPGVTLTESKAKAGYDVMLEPVPGSKGVKSGFGLAGVVHKTNRIEVTSKTGKDLFSETGHSTTQLVKDACSAIAAPEMKLAKN